MVRHIKFIRYRENKLTVIIRYVQNVHCWHKYKHASVLAIDQLCHQLATAPTTPRMQQTPLQLINVMNMTMTSYLRHM